MHHFIREFVVKEKGKMEIFFSATRTQDSNVYLVTTLDQQRRLHIFHMILEEGSWRIDRSKPYIADWILAMEEELASAIGYYGK